MDGPWTQFAPSSASGAPPPSGPWTQFAAPTGGELGFAPAPPEPTQPEAPVSHWSDAGQNEYGITGDPQQFNDMKPGAAALAIDRVGQAAVKGYQDTEPVFTPKMQALVDDAGPLGRYIVNPVAHILGAVPAGFNAIGAGTTQAVNEATTAAGVPTLARDINPLIMSGAIVMGGKPNVPVTRSGLAAREMQVPQAPRFIGEAGSGLTPDDTVAAPLSPGFLAAPGVTAPTMAAGETTPTRVMLGAPAANAPVNTLADFGANGVTQAPNPLAGPAPTGWSVDDRFGPAQAAPAAASPYVPITSTQVQRRDGVGAIEAGRRADAENAANAPAPQSVGAAASRDLTNPSELGMTPKQVQAYRSTAEGEKLLESQTPGVQDANTYVNGSNPNAAEIEQSVNTARELKALNITAPDVAPEAKAIADANNEARRKHFNDAAGSDVDVANAKAALEAQDQADLANAWANKKSADIQPVLDAAAEIKASGDGRRPLVRNVVDSVVKQLYDDNGEAITDPEILYGVRKHIDDLINENDAAGQKKNERAMASLLKLKGVLDNEVIEPAAEGFQQYLTNHRLASIPIDEMTILQKHEPKLFDAQNRMTYNKVQTFMRQVVDSRQAPGVNPYKSISDTTMQKLWALRDDLRRSASAQELARTPGGSDTAQNMFDVLKGATKGHAATMGATLIGNAIGGPVGGAVTGLGKSMLENMFSARAARQANARGMSLLHPDPATYPMRNQLLD